MLGRHLDARDIIVGDSHRHGGHTVQGGWAIGVLVPQLVGDSYRLTLRIVVLDCGYRNPSPSRWIRILLPRLPIELPADGRNPTNTFFLEAAIDVDHPVDVDPYPPSVGKWLFTEPYFVAEAVSLREFNVDGLTSTSDVSWALMHWCKRRNAGIRGPDSF